MAGDGAIATHQEFTSQPSLLLGKTPWLLLVAVVVRLIEQLSPLSSFHQAILTPQCNHSCYCLLKLLSGSLRSCCRMSSSSTMGSITTPMGPKLSSTTIAAYGADVARAKND